MAERSGSCLCGAVRYRFGGDVLAARICWCRDCQHLAANGSVNVLVPTAALEFSGELRDYLRVAASGNEVRRRFCPVCGTHVFGNSSVRPEFTVVRVGTLDDPSSVRPSSNIWANSAPSWACLDPTLERIEGQSVPAAMRK